MDKMKIEKLAQVIGGQLLEENNGFVDSIAIDSRQVKSGSVFFALKGETQDGHKFLENAADGGASVLIVSDLQRGRQLTEKTGVIVVDDTLKALHRLAKWKMSQLDVPVLAVTGSVGKTTTRDLVSTMLASTYKIGVSAKNYNSETGLPLTVMSFNDDIEVAVLEMGMDALGQIHDLADIARPDVAIITNVGVSHLERLGTVENICRAKLEIVDFFNQKNALIIPSGGLLEQEAKAKAEQLGFDLTCVDINCPSTRMNWQVVVDSVINKGDLGLQFEIENSEGIRKIVRLPIVGGHNVVNFMLALEAAIAMGVNVDDGIRAVENMTVTGERMKVSTYGNITVLNDAYNAAPVSMCSAIETLDVTAKEKGTNVETIAVLGGMNELGSFEVEGHAKVADAVMEKDVDRVITVGDKALLIDKRLLERGYDKFCHYDCVEEACKHVNSLISRPSVILLKGSRSFQIEKFEDAIKEMTNNLM